MQENQKKRFSKEEIKYVQGKKPETHQEPEVQPERSASSCSLLFPVIRITFQYQAIGRGRMYVHFKYCFKVHH